jgi:hypothetical protein
MSLLKEFEIKTRISAASLTEEKLIEIMISDNYKDFFIKPGKAAELVDELIQVNSDEIFKKELYTIREMFNLNNIERKSYQNLSIINI